MRMKRRLKKVERLLKNRRTYKLKRKEEVPGQSIEELYKSDKTYYTPSYEGSEQGKTVRPAHLLRYSP